MDAKPLELNASPYYWRWRLRFWSWTPPSSQEPGPLTLEPMILTYSYRYGDFVLEMDAKVVLLMVVSAVVKKYIGN